MRQVSTVVPVGPDRLPELIQLGESFYAEAKLPGKLVPEIFYATWRQLLTGPGAIFGLESDGKLVGAIGGVTHPDPNGGELVAMEMFWYVDPASRGGGLRLLHAFERWAGLIGAKRLVLCHMLSSMPETLARMYERLGYHPAEVHYIKEVT